MDGRVPRQRHDTGSREARAGRAAAWAPSRGQPGAPPQSVEGAGVAGGGDGPVSAGTKPADWT
jgi:hypothetical protein